MPPRSSLALVALALLTGSALPGCPREAFIPGCDDTVSAPDPSETVASIGWSGQDLIDRATGLFTHPDAEWSNGDRTTVYLSLTPDSGSLQLHTLTEQTPPDGVPVANIAPLCFDSLSVGVQVDMRVDGGLDARFDATVVVTGGDDNPAMRDATLNHQFDLASLSDPWTWRELDPNEWDTTGLSLSLRLTPTVAAPGALVETGERTQGDVAEAAGAEVLSWGDAAGDDDDDDDDDDSGGGDCASAQDALAAEIYDGVQGCTATVRLHHQSLALLGYELFCGPYSAPTEAAARASAEAATGYGATGSLLSGASPEDQWVFWQAAGDFGGASAVDARTGLVTFGGSTVWDGAGELTYPTSWLSASDLGSCPAMALPPVRRGFSLIDGVALPATSVDAVLAVVYGTALPGAFWSGGYVFDAVVLEYPRSVGVFDPSTAEWVVLLAGGWLE